MDTSKSVSSLRSSIKCLSSLIFHIHSTAQKNETVIFLTRFYSFLASKCFTKIRFYYSNHTKNNVMEATFSYNKEIISLHN